MSKIRGRPARNMMRRGRWARLALGVGLFLILVASAAWGFAEEPLHFRDPYSGQIGDDWEEISTIHDDLTYVLALAAGFSVSDSITLQIWDQLVDSEHIGPGEAISYTNCSAGQIPPPPDVDAVCGLKPHSRVIWPMPDAMQDAEHCATSRFGPYSPFFHFPHDNKAELGALRDWAWGLSEELVGYEAYAWGGPAEFTVLQASCLYTRTSTIVTGMEPGSLQAFATYLHSLADYYSHRECIAHMDELGMPWATHTLGGHPACDYNPANPQTDDVHGREFYTYTDAARTDEAIQHIYRELRARSLQREGAYWPLDMDEPLVGLEGSPTLAEVLSTFVHQWTFEEAAQRRAWLDEVAPAILAQRAPRQTLHLPLLYQTPPAPALNAAAQPLDWGELVTTTTPYTIYKADFLYADSFLTTDLRYADRESYENHALTIYRAHDGRDFLQGRPVVFFVHGGGWVDGYRDWYEFVARSFTGYMGWVTVVIDYRLTSDQVFIADEYCPDRVTCEQPDSVANRTKAAWYPDNIEDVAAAFAWVRANIAQHGGDPENIVIFGHSAGGHLVSLLATHEDYAENLRPHILGVVSLSGAYDINEVNPFFWSAIVDQTYPGGFSNTALLTDASPDAYLKAGMALPPFQLLYAQYEAPSLAEQALAFDARLTSFDFEHELVYLKGYNHLDEMTAIADMDAEPTQRIVAWMQALFAANANVRVHLPMLVRE
ncbi:MAG: alpha/beta hydrolase [Chloroflexi bacterium]|nr:alpha/beta hydrolase [Chloroflexota bacterium]